MTKLRGVVWFAAGLIAIISSSGALSEKDKSAGGGVLDVSPGSVYASKEGRKFFALKTSVTSFTKFYIVTTTVPSVCLITRKKKDLSDCTFSGGTVPVPLCIYNDVMCNERRRKLLKLDEKEQLADQNLDSQDSLSPSGDSSILETLPEAEQRFFRLVRTSFFSVRVTTRFTDEDNLISLYPACNPEDFPFEEC